MNKNKKINRIIDKKLNMYNMNYYFNFGYKNFGPLLYSFSIWLKKELEKEELNKVFFLSRDGFILKEAFDMMFKDEFKSFYLYASRRSVIVPSLWKVKSPLEIFDCMTLGRSITLNSFIKKIGLEDYDLSNFLSKYNLIVDEKYKPDVFKNDEKVLKFLNDIFPIICENSKREWNSFNSYADNNSFKGNVAIVDIGWYATMQQAITKIRANVSVKGYYLGMYPGDGYYSKECAKGFIVDKTHDQKNFDIINLFITIFEFLTLARHGSVKRFIENDNGVEFYEYEYANLREKNISEEIQKGALQFIEDFQNTDESKVYCKLENAIENLIHKCIYPNYEDAKMLGDILFSNDELKHIAKPKNIKFYILHPKIFFKDFYECNWKIGFLKRLFVIKLPYYKVVVFLKNRRNGG